jgi:hypothetical protein
MGGRDAKRPCSGSICRVIHDHRASFADALVFSDGEMLRVEKRKTVWDGWIWCLKEKGMGAWVPESYMERCGDMCTALRDYDSTELTVNIGDILEAYEEASGWLWCRDREGRQGWVPALCVEEEARSR